MNSRDVFQGIPQPVVPGSRPGFDLLVVHQRNAQLICHFLLGSAAVHSRFLQPLTHILPPLKGDVCCVAEKCRLPCILAERPS